MSSRETLHKLGLKHGTNKSFRHGFLHFYPTYMEHLRDKPVDLLELGIGKVAGSVKMWDEYFTHAASHFTVIDWDEERLKRGIKGDRWTNLKADIKNKKKLKMLVEQLGPFDFIIDDCVHAPFVQVQTFKTLWPHLKPGGVYFMEDIGKSYIQPQKGYSVDQFLNQKLHSFVPEERHLPKPSSIYFIHFYQHIVIIGKRKD